MPHVTGSKELLINLEIVLLLQSLSFIFLLEVFQDFWHKNTLFSMSFLNLEGFGFFWSCHCLCYGFLLKNVNLESVVAWK